MVFSNAIKTLAEVNVWLALFHRGVIVHTGDSLDQVIIKLPYPNDDGTLLRSPHVFAALLRKTLPPIFETGCSSGSPTLRLARISITGGRSRFLLRKG